MYPELKEQLQPIKYVVLLNIQATCDKDVKLNPCQEVIELNAILCQISEIIPKKINEFRRLVRPKINGKITPFCKEMTGISSAMLNKQAYLDEVLADFEAWLSTEKELHRGNSTFLTWGFWPLEVCLTKQLQTKKLKFPEFIGSYVNLSNTLQLVHGQRERKSLNQWNTIYEIKPNEKQNISKGENDSESLFELFTKLCLQKQSSISRKDITKIFHQIPGVTTTKQLEYLLVLDFEATCEDNVKLQPCSEIIELPVMIIDLHHRKVIDTFHKYITPTFNPKLTKFCTELTGITQEMVDHKHNLKETLQQFDEWIQAKPYLHSRNFTFVTCGDWDLANCLKKQCREKKLQQPSYMMDYINIKFPVVDLVPALKNKTGMMGMLEHLGLPHEGRHHSGIDDVRNICSITIKLLEFEGFRYTRKLLRFVK